jgi:hypothetical protein
MIERPAKNRDIGKPSLPAGVGRRSFACGRNVPEPSAAMSCVWTSRRYHDRTTCSGSIRWGQAERDRARLSPLGSVAGTTSVLLGHISLSGLHSGLSDRATAASSCRAHRVGNPCAYKGYRRSTTPRRRMPSAKWAGHPAAGCVRRAPGEWSSLGWYRAAPASVRNGWPTIRRGGRSWRSFRSQLRSVV